MVSVAEEASANALLSVVLPAMEELSGIEELSVMEELAVIEVLAEEDAAGVAAEPHALMSMADRIAAVKIRDLRFMCFLLTAGVVPAKQN